MDESFTCPMCGMTSYNPNDVRERYCGSCHAFVGNLEAWWRWLFGDGDPDWPWVKAMWEQGMKIEQSE